MAEALLYEGATGQLLRKSEDLEHLGGGGVVCPSQQIPHYLSIQLQGQFKDQQEIHPGNPGNPSNLFGKRSKSSLVDVQYLVDP